MHDDKIFKLPRYLSIKFFDMIALYFVCTASQATIFSGEIIPSLVQ